MECGFVAASTWARRLADVDPRVKKRARRGWRKEWKTILAPLWKLLGPSIPPGGRVRAGITYLNWGRHIQRTKTSLRM